MKKVIILLFLICLLTGCRDFGREVVDFSFVNKTRRQLLVNLQFQSVSDTSLWKKTSIDDKLDCVVNPLSTRESRYIKEHLQDMIDGFGAIRFIIYDIDTLKGVSWERISKEYIIVKRIDFYSLDNLNCDNCVITIE